MPIGTIRQAYGRIGLEVIAAETVVMQRWLKVQYGRDGVGALRGTGCREVGVMVCQAVRDAAIHRDV